MVLLKISPMYTKKITTKQAHTPIMVVIGHTAPSGNIALFAIKEFL